MEEQQNQDANISKSNKGSYIVVTIAVIVLLAAIVGGIMYVSKSVGKPKLPYAAVIEAKDSKDGVHVDNKNDKSTVYYRVAGSSADGSEEFFVVDTPDGAFSDMKSGLDSPFFDCADRTDRKMVYIILDISKSVVDSAGGKYFEQVASTIENIIDTEGLQPGDQIRLRFMGTNNDRLESLDFTGPHFEYDIAKNSVQKKDILTLLSISSDPITKCKSNDSVTSVQDLTQKIETAYEQRKENPDMESNISGLLAKIASEVSLEKTKFQSVRYIMFTDGDSTDGYDSCDTQLADQCGQDLKDLDMNNNPDNKAYVIWVKGTPKQDIIRRMFDGITINFQ